ncbi:MAG: N-formylglutamate amidohydrolase [Caulobacteraceae bacterium]|nr:N-formylglutamate amidohydrolase [Caulobacteraceae bacterium]
MLDPDDLSPVLTSRDQAASPFLLLGDHAGRAIPRGLGGLGLAPGAMDGHIAWDIGVEGLGERLSASLDACFLRQTYSRLVIDCNRRPGAPGSIPAVSDGVAIPGNAALSAAEIRARTEEIYTPYQGAIAAMIEARKARGQPTVLLALHSFTPVMQGIPRPWRYGVLHRNDSPASRALLGLLRQTLGDQAGDNQPYALDETDNTIPLHAAANGLDYVELEVRQDLIEGPAGQDEAAALIGCLLPQVWAALTDGPADR